jgi:hypothetical protein
LARAGAQITHAGQAPGVLIAGLNVRIVKKSRDVELLRKHPHYMRGAGRAAGVQQNGLAMFRGHTGYLLLPRPMRLTFLFLFFLLADC